TFVSWELQELRQRLVRSWRVCDHRHDAGGRRLELDLLGDIQSVIHLNPEISDCALQLRVAEQSCAILRILLSH
ncbi:MAG: hypothetical protein QOJ58_5840, partial [Alphaproteobacteria bacterium]|nr:hypothetical protein [Alphaproteobacteria bacterium]